jgi:MFS superfamily sulfate permease-like transporter
VIASTVAVSAFGLHDHHGVSVLGAIAHGPPHFGLPGLSWTRIQHLAPIAGVVALVVVTQSAATTRAFADRGGKADDVGRDLLGVGAGSVLAGISGSFPVNASPPRTAAAVAAGGRTQAAGLAAAAAMIAVIPAAGALKDLPLATLAGILVFVATRVVHGRDLLAIARFDRLEFALALVTMITVALLGVEQGIGLAVGLAILDRTRRSARPQLHVLGRVPGTTSWTPMSGPEGAEAVPGVLLVLFATPLWYANAIDFRDSVMRAFEAAGSPHVVVLDAIGMSDIDYTGARALSEVLDELTQAHAEFAVARAGDRVHASLARSGLLQRIGEDHLFATADAAVSALAGAAITERSS